MFVFLHTVKLGLEKHLRRIIPILIECSMEGPSLTGPEDPNAGMIPRAVQQIYSACKALEQKGWVYTMEAQFLEIYNETLRDLLDEKDVGKKMEIKHDSKNRTSVTDAITGIFYCFSCSRRDESRRSIYTFGKGK